MNATCKVFVIQAKHLIKIKTMPYWKIMNRIVFKIKVKVLIPVFLPATSVPWGQQNFLTDSIASIQLVRYVRVVLSGHALANSRLHQSWQGGQHVDGWVYLSIKTLLAFVCNSDYAPLEASRGPQGRGGGRRPPILNCSFKKKNCLGNV